MPNIPTLPASNAALAAAFFVGLFGWGVSTQFVPVPQAVGVGVLAGSGIAMLVRAGDRQAAIRKYALFALPMLGILLWVGGRNEVWFAVSCAMAFGGFVLIIDYIWPDRKKPFMPLGREPSSSPVPPPAPSAAPFASPTMAPPSPATPLADDPFAFDAARFEAARAAPPPSFFLTQVKKLNVDLSSDHEAKAFAGALNTQAKNYIVQKLDEEINDPNTPLELRHFLIRVRAYFLGQTPAGELPRLEDKR